MKLVNIYGKIYLANMNNYVSTPIRCFNISDFTHSYILSDNLIEYSGNVNIKINNTNTFLLKSIENNKKYIYIDLNKNILINFMYKSIDIKTRKYIMSLLKSNKFERLSCNSITISNRT